MTRVLGLDVSTSCVGVAVVDQAEDGTITPVLLDHVTFPSKVKTLWEKAEILRDHLNSIRRTYHVISRVIIEDAAKKFTTGRSSASTIAVCMRFNGMATYVSYITFGIDPEYIPPTSARKLCGLKMQQKKKCGKSHKEQTAEYIMANDLKGKTWPLKRTGKVVDWSYDVIDAYVIAKAGLILSTSTTQEK